MRKLLVVIAFMFCAGFTFNAEAQKLAYVDTEYVLNQMPVYQEAQSQIDNIVASWKKEIEQRYQEIDQMYREFQAEQVLLSDAQRKDRENAIINKEKATREFQKQKFGGNGELNQRKEQLLGPVQEQVYASLEQLSVKKRIDIVLDKSAGVSILYANAQYDLTDDLLKELGISSKK